MSTFTTVGREKGRLLLTKRRFIQFHKLQEGMDSDEAEEEWEKAEANPKVYREPNEDGELTIAVKDNVRLRHFSGQRKLPRRVP